MKQLLFHYIPYGVIDVLVTVLIVNQFVTGRFDLIWASIPLLLLGISSLNRKMRSTEHDPDA